MAVFAQKLLVQWFSRRSNAGVASTVAASPEEASVTSTEETLTPAQKAARTRAANKARKEAELAAATAEQ